jgi:hypothetical protein
MKTDIQELSAKTIETTKDAIAKAPDLGRQVLKAADSRLHTVVDAMPKTEQQRHTEQRGKLFRWGSITTGALAITGAGIKFGPNLVRTYGPGIKQQASELMGQIPFGKSHAERRAAMHDATFNPSPTAEETSYPSEAPSTTPYRTEADQIQADEPLAHSAPIAAAPFESRQDSH